MVDPLVPDAPAHVFRVGRVRCRVAPTTPRIRFRPSIPVVYPNGHDDRLLIVRDLGQTRLAEVRDVVIDRPTWILNGVGSMGFTCSAHNDAMDHLVDESTVVDGAGVMQLVGREVQWWRDGVLRWAGPPVSGRPDTKGTVQFQCMDLGWHLAKKFFGAAERRDLLLDVGSMDVAGLPGWAEQGAVSKARDTVDKVRGAGSMVLSGTGSVTATFTQPARTPAPVVHLTASVKIPEGTPEGTLVAKISTFTMGGSLVDTAEIRTDSDTIHGAWQRVTTYTTQPSGAPHRFVVYLHSPGVDGSTKFDDVRSLENNTTGIPTPGADLTQHAAAGLNHMQAGYGQGTGFGFGFEVLSPAGTSEVLGERHLNHTQWSDFLRRYTSRDDGFDWRIDPERRVFQVADRIGFDHENIALHERMVSAGGWTHDETNLASKVVVPGEGNGVDRPEGGYTDTSRTAGLTYDDFWQPPADTPLSALDPMARQRWEEVSQPQITLEDMAVSDDMLGTLNPGDTIRGTLKIGKFRLPVDRSVRIGQVQLDAPNGQLVLS